ncbi:MAG: hypothetical protein K6T73_03385 [Candidatus Bathyarchaeota archaeon]|nr:hypothetical protein [Candidatus Bathyarchaeota archaeon]
MSALQEATDKIKEFLAWNKDNIFINLIQAEDHLRNVSSSLPNPEFLNCVVKHLAYVEGEADEAVSHALILEGPRASKEFAKLRDAVRELRLRIMSGKLSSPEQGIEEVRKLRAQFEYYNPEYDVSKCSSCGAAAPLLKQLRLIKEEVETVKASLKAQAGPIIKKLSEKFNVPEPEIEIGSCPNDPQHSCYYLKYKKGNENEILEEKLFLHPKNLTPRIIAHEFGHYYFFRSGEGDPLDEAEVWKWADEALASLGIDGNMPLQIVENINISTVQLNSRDPDMTIYGMLDPAYKLPVDIFKLPSEMTRTLNEAWTPEIVGSVFEVLGESMLTRLGDALCGLLGAVTLSAATMVPGLPLTPEDKHFAHQLAGHFGTRWFKLLAPANMTLAISEARDLGRSLAAFDFDGAKAAIMKSFPAISVDIETLRRTVEGLVTPPAAVPPPLPPPSAMPPIPVPTVKPQAFG